MRWGLWLGITLARNPLGMSRYYLNFANRFRQYRRRLNPRWQRVPVFQVRLDKRFRYAFEDMQRFGGSITPSPAEPVFRP